MDIRIPQKLPLLEHLCWNISSPYQLTPQQILEIYAGRWRYKDVLAAPNLEEQKFIADLERLYGHYPLLINPMTDKDNFFDRIDKILAEFDLTPIPDFPAQLAGGTLLSMEQGRYRLSQDLDFISNEDSYYRLYNWFIDFDPQVLFPSDDIKVTNIRKDRISIRMQVQIEDTPLKVEFIAEERFELEPADFSNSKIAKLSFNDRVTTKLLANRDRYLDDSCFSRDLIDLAMLRRLDRFDEYLFNRCKYNYKIKESLIEAVTRFQEKAERRQRCYSMLQIDNSVAIIDGLDLLAEDYGLAPTQREFNETDFSYLDE